MIRNLVIFGASGDLSARYLVPTLAQLHGAQKLPEELAILAVAPEDWDTASFHDQVRAKLKRHAPDVIESFEKGVVPRLQYRSADVTRSDAMKAALAPVREAAAFYLALPPSIFLPAARSIVAAGVPDGSRIVVEKPFGTDLASTRELNELLHCCFSERAIFRMDHFLGKQTVQNILGLRFANRIFEPLWNGRHIERVEITWDETLTVEGRAGFYDSTGALRDMLHNHLLQLLCLMAMEPPPTFGERDLRDYKVALLRAVRRLSDAEIAQWTCRGRYGAGKIGGRAVADYIREPGVDPARGTETFAQATLWIDNWRWAGVPFVLRSGKALGTDRREIAVHFKSVPHLAFADGTEPRDNALRIELNPDRLALALNVNAPGDPFDIEHIELDTRLAPQETAPYGRLLLDLLRGDWTLSIRDDEAEECWRIVEPILEAWRRGAVPLVEYAAGSGGPAGLRAS